MTAPPGPLAAALAEIAAGLSVDLARLPLSSAFREKYEIERLLACGSMGAVFLARQRELARPVALKFLVTDSDLMRARFRREASLMAQVSHPHVLRLLDHGDEEDLPYHAFEYLPGGTLASLIAKKLKLSPTEAVAIARQCLAGLAALHARGIVHRDLKPENVLFGDDAQARIADLGIARDETATAGLTRDGALLGTPRYMAPEQARGEPAGEAADLYAMGGMLYHMLSGEPPFAGGDPITLLRRHILEAPRPLSPVVAGVPPRVAEVVHQALAKDPLARPASANAFATALAQAIEPRTTARRETGGHPRRRRWLRYLAAPLLIALAVGALVRLVAPRPADRWVEVPASAPPREPRVEPPPDPATAARADVQATGERFATMPPGPARRLLVRELLGRLRARLGPRCGALLSEPQTHVAVEDLHLRADELKRQVEESMMSMLMTDPGSATRKPDFVRRTTEAFDELTRDLRDVAPAVMIRGAPAIARAHFAQTAMIFLRPSFQILDVRIKNRYDDEIRRWTREHPADFVGWFVESERLMHERQWVEQGRALDRAMALLEGEWVPEDARARITVVHIWTDVMARQSRNARRSRDPARCAALQAHLRELEPLALKVDPALTKHLYEPRTELERAMRGDWSH